MSLVVSIKSLHTLMFSQYGIEVGRALLYYIRMKEVIFFSIFKTVMIPFLVKKLSPFPVYANDVLVVCLKCLLLTNKFN